MLAEVMEYMGHNATRFCFWCEQRLQSSHSDLKMGVRYPLRGVGDRATAHWLLLHEQEASAEMIRTDTGVKGYSPCWDWISTPLPDRVTLDIMVCRCSLRLYRPPSHKTKLSLCLAACVRACLQHESGQGNCPAAVLATVTALQSVCTAVGATQKGKPFNVWAFLSNGVNHVLERNNQDKLRAFDNPSRFKHGLNAHGKMVVLLLLPHILHPVSPAGYEEFLAPVRMHGEYMALLLQFRCANLLACCTTELTGAVCISFTASEARELDDCWSQTMAAYLTLSEKVRNGEFNHVSPAQYAFKATPNRHFGAHYALKIAQHGPLRGVAVWAWESIVGGTASQARWCHCSRCVNCSEQKTCSTERLQVVCILSRIDAVTAAETVLPATLWLHPAPTPLYAVGLGIFAEVVEGGLEHLQTWFVRSPGW
jgi:hypothetical protein